MAKDKRIIPGILLLFAGFYVLIQTASFEKIFGIAIMAIGLYFILSGIE